MRKVWLELNLGKKTKARFPRRQANNLRLKIMVPALETSSLPTLRAVLSAYSIDFKSFSEDFDQMSGDYEKGFLVPINFWITQTKSYFYDFRSPTCFKLFHKCFDFYEGSDLYCNKKILLLCCFNLALIKNVAVSNILLDNFINTIKQILGSLRSYGFAYKKKKKQKKSNYFLRKNNYIYNTKFTKKKI